MTRLEDLQPTLAVRAILPDQHIAAGTARWFTPEPLKLMYETLTVQESDQ
jgi:hypothetical protein